METKKPTTLLIAKFILFSLFLLFTGGALVVTLNNNGFEGSGWTGSISWMWLPALFFLGFGVYLSKK